MNRRRKILLLALCGLIAVIAVCFFCLREREPSYNGRTLSEWLSDCSYYPEDPVRAQAAVRIRQDAELAVRAIGPAAIPTLFNLRERSQRSMWIAQRIDDTPNYIQFPWVIRIYASAAAASDKQDSMASAGFSVLGTNALPYLRAKLVSKDHGVRDFASNTIQQIDSDVLANAGATH
jgi:hypothetical protein